MRNRVFSEDNQNINFFVFKDVPSPFLRERKETPCLDEDCDTDDGAVRRCRNNLFVELRKSVLQESGRLKTITDDENYYIHVDDDCE
jgi:hypothetical protein